MNIIVFCISYILTVLGLSLVSIAWLKRLIDKKFIRFILSSLVVLPSIHAGCLYAYCQLCTVDLANGTLRFINSYQLQRIKSDMLEWTRPPFEFLIPPITLLLLGALLSIKRQTRDISVDYTHHIHQIGSLEPRMSRIYEAYLSIDPNSLYLEKPIIQRQLSNDEFKMLELMRYQEKDGWLLRDVAFQLKNNCPCCGHPLYIAYQKSPNWTWKQLCGRAGYLVYCPNCKKDLNFYRTLMN